MRKKIIRKRKETKLIKNETNTQKQTKQLTSTKN